MEKQIERQCRANAVFTDEAYLKTRYLPREDGGYTTVSYTHLTLPTT